MHLVAGSSAVGMFGSCSNYRRRASAKRQAGALFGRGITAPEGAISQRDSINLELVGEMIGRRPFVMAPQALWVARYLVWMSILTDVLIC